MDIFRPEIGVPEKGGFSPTFFTTQPFWVHQVIIRTATGQTMYPFYFLDLVEEIVKSSLFCLACFDYFW